jgi:arylsulfate sulfotransferase
MYGIIRVSWAVVLAGAGFAGGGLRAEVSISSLAPSLPSPQKIGTAVTFTATAADTDAGDLRYRFRVRPAGGTYSTMIDYGVSNQFNWMPIESEGTYEIEVSVRNRATGSTASQDISFAVTPGATSLPLASATTHPMVALYSAPACPAGSSMKVFFKRAFDGIWRSTSAKPCNGTSTMNFLVAGMLMNSTYVLRGEIMTGEQLTAVPDAYFSVPNVDAPVTPARSVLSLDPWTTYAEGATLFYPLTQRPFAVDGNGNLLWYLAGSLPMNFHGTRPFPGGNQGALFDDYGPNLERAGFREYDLTGTTVKQTTVERINDQLAALGKNTISSIHHEVRKLANGDYLMLGMVEVISDAQGANTDVLGDMILVLDGDLQVKWTWDSFEHLDVTRPAVLNETCSTGVSGCVVLKAPVANDWTHGNSLALTPDGNILYNSRHQDMAYKIAYANGTGDGSVIWRLGMGGDFTIQSTDPYPWFSHAHDLEFEGSNAISLFDDGNTRVSQSGGNSRGQVLQIDETNRTATLQVNADLGTFSAALGSAQLLSNGNLLFDAGLIPPQQTQAIETNPAGSVVSILEFDDFVYRTFRMPDLYSAPY